MTLQDFIHNVNVGKGSRTIRNFLIGLAALTLVVLYNWRCYHNMSTQEAMDSAQVARNLAEGRGFTTLFIRPFSIHLLQEHNVARYGPVPQAPHTDYAEVDGLHPDLANPPLYPCVLAVWMKTYHLGFRVLNGITSVLPGALKSRLPAWDEDPNNRFWQSNSRIWWWPGDFCIAMLNEGLFFAIVVLTFFLAKKLFDLEVAWMSVVLLAGTELMWRFSVSGLSTMLLVLMLMGLGWCLLLLEQEVREPKWGPRAFLWLPAAAGLLIGTAAMTRYSLACLIIPGVMFLIWYGGERRVLMCVTMAATFLVVCTPWIVRNYSVSGTPFGTTGYGIIDGTTAFPGYKLERSLNPDLNVYYSKLVGHKFANNLRDILGGELPRLGGGWVMPFFVLGLMVGFRSLALTRLRNFILTCLITLTVAQALGRTQLSTDSAEVNSENLLFLFTPLVVMYGVSLFYVLLNQMKLKQKNTRLKLVCLFGALTWLPLIEAVFPPRTPPLAYPPYWVPAIQDVGAMMNEHDLVMSDVPWAVAWYGRRQCVWLTPDSQDSFFAINDYIKQVRAVYLTPVTMDDRFLTQLVKGGQGNWGLFALRCLEEKNTPPAFPPPSFPLRSCMRAMLPDQLFITDWERWKVKAGTNGVANP